ncbi:hypothetical protein EVAR_3864_1 [Eumeta japonica]|uniref:Uncharacterized protein n=1 Tax=Eumeta variegata TaxID=151549 RepID=A0A4C1SQI9_EUMVA|nr:hypothetical protein EVAR_3864_1 [Eumeta japonica]
MTPREERGGWFHCPHDGTNQTRKLGSPRTYTTQTLNVCTKNWVHVVCNIGEPRVASGDGCPTCILKPPRTPMAHAWLRERLINTHVRMFILQISILEVNFNGNVK